SYPLGSISSSSSSSSIHSLFLSSILLSLSVNLRHLHSFPTRRSSDLTRKIRPILRFLFPRITDGHPALEAISVNMIANFFGLGRSEEHTSELQSRFDLVCRLLLEKKNMLKQS